MSLISAKQAKSYKWNPGDHITPQEAAALLKYKSPRNLQDDKRLSNIAKDFEAVGCQFTTGIFITGGRRVFLRSEIDAYLSRCTELGRNK